MSDGPIDRIRSELGDGVVERLVDLPGTDLTSLLLHVMARRSEDAGAGELKRRYREDRFVGPGAANLRSLHETEAILLDAVPAHFDAIVLSPVAPSGIHPCASPSEQRDLDGAPHGCRS